MAEQYLSTDPNAGVEDQYLSTDPNAGLEPPKEGGVGAGVLSAVGNFLNPINLAKGALGLGQPSDISQIMRYGKTLGEIVTGTSPDEAIGRNIPELQHEREAFYGKLGTKEQAAELTGLGLQAALLAAPFIHGKVLPRAPGSLSEVAGIKPVEAAPEAVPQTPEPPISETVQPLTPESVPKVEEVIPNAEQVQGPARPDVNVQLPGGAQAREGYGGEMPANVGGEGVPEGGQGEALQQTQEVAAVPPEQPIVEPPPETPVLEVAQEPAPVSQPTEITTAQPLPKSEAGASTGTQPVEPPAAPPTVPAEAAVPKTGVSSERFVEQYGEDAPVPNTGKSAGELKRIGQTRLDNFQKTGDVKDDPYAVLTNLREGKVPVSQLANDVSLIRAEHQRLRADAINAEGTPEYESKSQAALDMAQAIKEVAHGPASDMMRAFQEYDKPRYDNVTDFDQALRERLGRESTSQERVKFREMADDVKSTRNGAEEAINGAQKRLSKMPKLNFEDAMKSVHDQIAELTKDCVL